ncbi:hypothetical protein D770_24305 [Flammeovirgaceae bacterium 311]|nr:hypothetical protein D770_24305 [Flammeovirgaceae bacterium 311]
MKKLLLYLSKTVWLIAFIGFPACSHAQILVQDFEELGSVQQWSGTQLPAANRVNNIESSVNGTFTLQQQEGSQVLQLAKASNQQSAPQAFFHKSSDFENQGVVKVQFDLSVTADAATRGVLGSIYVGQNLGSGGFIFPENNNRFATININFAGGNAFSIANAIGSTPTPEESSGSITGLARVTIILNNTAGTFTYLAPNGEASTVGAKRIDIWVDRGIAVNEAVAQAAPGASISALKFMTRNNALQGTASFGNLLIDEVPPAVVTPVLNPAGGSYTVGVGGDFTSLTRPGGVFQALNQLGSISGPLNFVITSNLIYETGEVALHQIEGASESNIIQLRPQNKADYRISGSNIQAWGALIRLKGTDWIRFDGRTLSGGGGGMGSGGHLLFRNAGAAPTFHFEGDATHNTIAFSLVQGASASAEQAVIFMGNGVSSGNDGNTFLYNHIGGYGSQRPVNALASRNTASGNTTDNVLIEGNQFYDFAAAASLNVGGNPCTIMAGPGNSSWRILRNHLYQERQSAPVLREGLVELQGVCIRSGTDYLVEGNLIGGSAPFAAGSPLSVTIDENGSGIPPHPSVIPFSIHAQGGKVDIINNTATNIEVTGRPVGCDDLAFGSVVLAGEVNFIDNTFGDPAGNTSITARNINNSTVNAGSYLVVPVYYRGQTGNTTSGVVRGNFIGSVRLEGNVSGAGYSDTKFIGILNNQNASAIEISQNTIANVRSAVSGRLSVSMVGIHARGGGATDIFRNVIYGFYNNSTAVSVVCPTSLGEGNVAGIVADNIAGETRVANNMITFEDIYPQSQAVYYGIYVPSNSSSASKIFYNSVYVYGGENNATGRNYVFYRSGTSRTEVRNNIFLNTRATTQNANFVIATSRTSGWTSGNNLLHRSSGVPSLNDFGRYGSILVDDCSSWSGSTLEQNSICGENIEQDFVDPVSGNLRMVQTPEPSVVVDAGYEIEEIENDIDFVLRIDPDIGASEVYNAWIGMVSDDWFNPANWSARRVPDCPNNDDQHQAYNMVSILPNGTRIFSQVVSYQPVIRRSPGPANYRNLTILEGASITIAERHAELRQCGELDPLIEGITNRGSIQYTGPGKISLRGVLNNEGTFNAGTGTLSLNGETGQFINSTEPLELWRLLVEGGGPKDLQTDVLVQSSLDLVEGIMLSSPEAILTMAPGAVLGAEGAPGNTAHVAGPMVKYFNSTDEFVFPVGDNDRLGLVAVIPASASPAAYRVAYHFRAPPYPVVRTEANAEFFADGIEQVSPTEYWTIEPLQGSPRAQIVLYWDEASGVEAIENKQSDLSVVRWNEDLPAWVDEGYDGTQEAPAPELGRLFSNREVSGYGVFTFGSPNPTVPLPVALTYFAATLQNSDVLLDWETKSEKNSSHFNIQRSKDGMVFNNIGQLASAGNSSKLIKYQYADAKIADRLAGAVYYRLEQVDIDGTTDYSKVVVVVLPDEAFSIRGVYPNPFRGELVVNITGSKEQRLALRLLNMAGKRLVEQEVSVMDGENIMPVLEAAYLQAGMYILEVSSSEMTKKFKVIKK